LYPHNRATRALLTAKIASVKYVIISDLWYKARDGSRAAPSLAEGIGCHKPERPGYLIKRQPFTSLSPQTPGAAIRPLGFARPFVKLRVRGLAGPQWPGLCSRPCTPSHAEFHMRLPWPERPRSLARGMRF